MEPTRTDLDSTILNAAMWEFAENGFYDTVVSEISDRAGVGKGTIYRHFGTKTDLFVALMKQATLNLETSIRKIYDEADDPEQQVNKIFWTHLDYLEEGRPLVRIIINEGLGRVGNHRSDVIQTWKNYDELVCQVFRRGVKKGVFRSSSPEKLSRLFLSWIWGFLRSSVVFAEDNPRARFGDLLIDMFMEGLKNE